MNVDVAFHELVLLIRRFQALERPLTSIKDQRQARKRRKMCMLLWKPQHVHYHCFSVLKQMASKFKCLLRQNYCRNKSSIKWLPNLSSLFVFQEYRFNLRFHLTSLPFKTFFLVFLWLFFLCVSRIASYKTHQLICTICPRSLRFLWGNQKFSCVISTTPLTATRQT